jgi:hypothetical protein
MRGGDAALEKADGRSASMKPDRHAEIAKRAYAIWEKEGRPDGRAIEHWLRAEVELGAQKPVKPGGSRTKRATRVSR